MKYYPRSRVVKLVCICKEAKIATNMKLWKKRKGNQLRVYVT